MKFNKRAIIPATLLICFCLLLPLAATVNAQQTTRTADGQASAVVGKPDLNLLPPELRERGQKLLDQKDEQKRAKLTGELLATDPKATLDFMLAVFATDPAVPVRRVILYELGRRPNFSSHPHFVQTLERCVATEPDASVAISALDKLRAHRMREMRKQLTQRLEAARQKNEPKNDPKFDEAAFRLLAREDERWISLVNGTMLPEFLRTPPPLFTLKATDKPVRVVTFGDFGQGAPENRKLAGEEQKQVAAAMMQAHRQTPFDFGLTLGDNFYPDGMESLSDARWQTQWRELYDPLGLNFYATLGNHDWHAADSPAAELLFTQQGTSWRMPAPYYTYTAGPAQFFALDTNEVSEAQLLWLQDALKQSRAKWKVVYGHHPIYSGGRHGVSQTLMKRLLPVIEGRVDIYLAGHEHDMQHIKPADSKVHFFVNGAGGAGIRQTGEKLNSLFALGGTHGFATLEADANTLTVKFIGTDLKTLYAYTLSKNGQP